MNHTTSGISNHDLASAAGEAIWGASNPATEEPDFESGKPDMAAVADRRYIDALDFDCVRASQARSDFIKATIIFFGLDGECPSLSDILSA
jgi:hypothetical protein